MGLVIGSGLYRRRLIEVPSYLEVPTKAVVRLALGNALGEKTRDADVLDLFAGSGAVGIELLSRGASHCVFVDENPEAIATIKGNLAKLGCDRGVVLHGEALGALSVLASKKDSFDIVFIDPPYSSIELYRSSIEFVLNHALLRPQGVLVVEHEKGISLPTAAFSRVKSYNHGRSHLTILWR